MPGAAQPHLTTRWTQRHLLLVSCGTAILAVIFAALSILADEPVAMTVLYLTGMVSALAFLAIDRSRLNPLELRIAADVALLTPLLFLPAFF